MKILQICNRIPYPPKDGGAIGFFNTTKAFWQLGVENTLLALNTKKHYIRIEELPEDFTKFLTQIHTVNINTNVNLWKALKNLFSKKSYNIERFYSQDLELKIIELLELNNFDIIQLEGLYVTMYVDIIRKHTKAKIVYRSHNVEYVIWQRMSEKSYFPKNIYLKLLTKRLKKYELGILNSFDMIATVTEKDAHLYKKEGGKIPIFPVISGVDMDKFKIDRRNWEENSLFFLGSLDWMPNLEAVEWFINKVWKIILNKLPNVKFYLAGRNMPESIKNIKEPNVIIVGEVENAVDFINSKDIMISPILSGSGIRIKIIEAMALGKPIVSTSVGAEGIKYTNKHDIMIGNTPKQFAEAIEQIIKNKELKYKLGKNALNLAIRDHTNKKVIKKMLEIYNQKI